MQLMDTDLADITVIIPLYNKEDYVKRAIDSVLKQTYTDYELLVVDDGSTDDSPDIVRSYNDPRIKLVCQENAGVSAARNKGVSLAENEYIAFLDADDEWMPDFLENCKLFLDDKCDLIAVLTNFIRSKEGQPYFSSDITEAYILEDYFGFALCHGGFAINSSNVVVRRKAFRKTGGFPVGRKFGEDIDTWARLAWQGPVGFIPEALSIYHDNTEGAVATCTPFFDVLPTVKEWHKRNAIPENLIKSCFKWAWRMRMLDIDHYISIGKKAKAFRMLLDASMIYAEKLPYMRLFAKVLLPGYLLKRLQNWRTH